MRTAASTDMSRRELAERTSGDLEVKLYWSPRDGSISIEVYQPSIEETITFRVAPERALDAFYHPFAHLADQAEDAIEIAVASGAWLMS